MSLPDARPEILDFLGNQPAIGPVGGRLRGGSGPFPFGQFGERIGLAWTSADAYIGRRQRASVSITPKRATARAKLRSACRTDDRMTWSAN
jgi:hypothetical protein